MGLAVWDGGNLEQLIAAATAGGARSIFVGSGGRLVGYTIGAPSFVNGSFVAAFADGNVPAMTAFLLVAR